eukprot:6148379-Pyramimonas_sp.AAC.1
MGPRSAGLSGEDACEHRHWGLRWSSPWGHKALYWTGDTHASTTTDSFGGALYGVTKYCSGWGRHMRTPPLRPSVELPLGPRRAVLCGRAALEHRQWGIRWSSLWGNDD